MGVTSSGLVDWTPSFLASRLMRNTQVVLKVWQRFLDQSPTCGAYFCVSIRSSRVIKKESLRAMTAFGHSRKTTSDPFLSHCVYDFATLLSVSNTLIVFQKYLPLAIKLLFVSPTEHLPTLQISRLAPQLQSLPRSHASVLKSVLHFLDKQAIISMPGLTFTATDYLAGTSSHFKARSE